MRYQIYEAKSVKYDAQQRIEMESMEIIHSYDTLAVYIPIAD